MNELNDNAYKPICDHDKCTGCMACMSSCHSDAIVFTSDDRGFKYPMIRKSACIDCGLCIKTCPVNSPVLKSFPTKSYAFALKDDQKLKQSASGGAARFIAEKILLEGGIVYGCSGEDMTHVAHVRISEVSELDKLSGSKYVQSDMQQIAANLLKDLKAGLRVLFIGTPCQVAGVKNAVRKDYDNLLTADLVCHGIPSQQILNENIDYYRTKYPDIVVNSIRFREKVATNNAHSIKYGFSFDRASGERVSIKWSKDAYMAGFLCSTIMRDCCYKCDYAYSARVSDLTISDYWGLPSNQGFVNGKGVSNILVNTTKGQAVIDSVSNLDKVHIEIRTIQEAVTGNGSLKCPTAITPEAMTFKKLYPESGLHKSIKKALSSYLFKLKIKSSIKKIISKLH